MFQSLRVGHATNSSSAHSVIMHSSFAHLDSIDGDRIRDYYSSGRDHFTITDKESKVRYLLQANFEDASHISHHQRFPMIKVLEKHGLDAEKLLSDLVKIEMDEISSTVKCPDGVPLTHWIDFILSNPIAFYGYDDNNEPPYEEGDIDIMGIKFNRSLKWKSDGAALVGYDKYTGNKFRWSAEPYLKSTTPELVDVKITDWCGYGCKFCYQGSTKRGKHASLENLEAIFDQLKAMDVFEIAVGGGEPAHHPQFVEIIEMAKARGLTFNFTAYGTDWAQDPCVITALKDKRGYSEGFGVGISVHNAKDLVKVKRVKDAFSKERLWGSKVIGQTVVGATPTKVTKELIEACASNHMPIILLGFKPVGRGAKFKVSESLRKDVLEILTYAKEVIAPEGPMGDSGFHLSVDTQFLDLHGDVLDEMKVPHILRTSPEGAFSMYVDAVEMTAGPSSYCDKSLMQPVGNLQEQFATF
jgi:hypothetical protein